MWQQAAATICDQIRLGGRQIAARSAMGGIKGMRSISGFSGPVEVSSATTGADKNDGEPQGISILQRISAAAMSLQQLRCSSGAAVSICDAIIAAMGQSLSAERDAA